VLLLVEELLQLSFAASMGAAVTRARNEAIANSGGLDLALSYSENADTLELVLETGAALENIFDSTATDDLSKSIITGFATITAEPEASGKRVFTLKLK
jgi:hypothetical protein